MDVGKRFELHRQTDVTGVSGVGIVAEGIQFRDGRVALRWLTATSSSALYDSMEHVQAIHGHEGATTVVWIDDDAPCACTVAPVEGPELQPNLADLSQMSTGVGGAARVGEVEICDDQACETAHYLVRGDHVSFVSLERLRDAQRRHPGKRDLHLQPHLMPSDVRLPAGYVVVHDASGRLLSKCDIYILKWRRSGTKRPQEIHPRDEQVARDYFGSNARIGSGSIEIPAAKWTRVTRVAVIRYRRYGFAKPFAHQYDPPVDLFMTKRPLAWRLPLPEGCVVDSRGFVRP